MGCLWSRIFPSARTIVEDTSRPIFHVWNIDEDGHYIKSCYIQVTDTDLVLHQRGEPPIIWPLISLRRYGFDTELFSFESGKRCATGPGIYAFKCKQAEALFNALQECLLVPRSDSEAVSNGNGEETEPHSSILGDTESNETGSLIMREMEKHEMLFDVQSGQSGLVNGHVTQPTAPSKPRKTKRRCLTQMDLLAQKSNKGLPPLGTFHTGKKFLPRCCAIGTCITASKQSKILNDKVLRKTTCGSCRTCSLNMCVVQTNASSVTYADRAKQADYGNVLDHGGHPRNCVHCCCDFKPTQKNGCSADDCPLHFNNCVDQITNYARLESHNRIELGEKMSLRRERLHQLQQPYAHVYTHIPTPVPRWPKTKSMSWRSLPQFGTTSSFNRSIVPRRSTSHFYANVSETGREKLRFSSLKSKSVAESDLKTSYLKLSFEEKQDSEASLAVLSSLSNSPKGSDLDVYTKIDFDKTGMKQSTGNQTNFDDEDDDDDVVEDGDNDDVNDDDDDVKINNFQSHISCGTQTS